jgi:hypothetical protein
MRIVFGWNHFKLKSYNPAQLGFPDPTDTNISIELRQGYFHFFYIPFFSIGKKWNIRKGGKLYEVPATALEHIRRQSVSAKTPWYTFAGPILIVAGLAIYGFSEQVEAVKADHNRENSFETKAAVLTQQLAKTDDHDYYRLTEKTVSGSNVLLKVTQVKDSNITFSMLTTGLSDYELSPMKMQYLFALKGDAAEKVTISKQKMLASIPRKYQEADKGTDLLDNGRLFTTREIYHLDGPLLVDRHTGFENRTNLSLDFLNQGWPGTLTKITNLSGDYKWTNHLPQVIATAQNDYDYNGQFHLNGTVQTSERKYKVELTMLDSLQKEHKYVVEGQGFSSTVTQEY